MASMSMASAGAAPAADIEWGALDINSSGYENFQAARGTSFDQFYTFSLDKEYSFSTTAVVNNNKKSIFKHNIVTLYSSSGVEIKLGSYPFFDLSTTHNFGRLPRGYYAIEVTADSVGTRTAYGTIQADVEEISSGPSIIINSVPEPESYALLLAGLGVMGFVARRRAAV